MYQIDHLIFTVLFSVTQLKNLGLTAQQKYQTFTLSDDKNIWWYCQYFGFLNCKLSLMLKTAIARYYQLINV